MTNILHVWIRMGTVYTGKKGKKKFTDMAWGNMNNKKYENLSSNRLISIEKTLVVAFNHSCSNIKNSLFKYV